ncbi:MAG: D-2-hydroxyacid dehydrogenase [Sciscionella sp.]
MVKSGTDRAVRYITDRPVLAVLCGKDRPSAMATVESAATVRYTGPDGLAGALDGADALFVWDFLSDAVAGSWSGAGSVGWVHIASAGVDKLLFPGIVDGEVTLTNSRGVFDGAIAEYVLAVILAFAKDLPHSLRLQGQRCWLHRESERIEGQRALIVGTGPIGAAVARLLRAAGMRVAGVGRRARAGDPDFGTVHSSDELLSHLPCADFVVAVAPLTEQTKGMFGREAFVAMRDSARLINVGRGALVATGALIDALDSGQIAGAALDVFETEPLQPNSPLWAMPNVQVSPHMSGDFQGWKDALAELFVGNFERWIAGERLHNVVDKSLGYVPSVN